MWKLESNKSVYFQTDIEVKLPNIFHLGRVGETTDQIDTTVFPVGDHIPNTIFQYLSYKYNAKRTTISKLLMLKVLKKVQISKVI